jgi:hypothetical protein
MKLLYINTGTLALININQSPSGESGNGPLTLPIAANSSFFITMLPLENDESLVYLPYTRKVSVAAGGAISVNDGLIELCHWPDNIIELNLNPLSLYKNEGMDMSPQTLSPLNFQTGGPRYTAYIYNDVSSSFAVEISELNRLIFISPLPFSVVSAEVTLIHIGEMPYLCATGSTSENKQFIYIAGIIPTFRTLLCTVCETYEIAGGLISVTTEGEYAQIRTSYENSDGVLTPAGKEYGWFTCEEKKPSTPEETALRLISAVREDMPEAAMKYLTPSLSEGLSFADLKEFLGNFTSTARPISSSCPQNCIALKYPTGKNIYTARLFCVETKKVRGELLIDNIREP